MTNLDHKIQQQVSCKGLLNGVCPYDCKSTDINYYYYCQNCFCELFPDDDKTKALGSKLKEIHIMNHLMKNHKNIGHWIYNKSNNKGLSRRIDFQILINDTVLCIESDQYQHKGYSADDEQIRYHQITTVNKYKYIFIRYNPDSYKTDNVVFDPPKETRLLKLSEEINIHIARIKNNHNAAKCEIFYLYYDGHNNDDDIIHNNSCVKKSIIDEIMNEKNDSEYITDDDSDELIDDSDNDDDTDELSYNDSDDDDNGDDAIVEVKCQNKNIRINKRKTYKNKTYDCNKCNKSFEFKSEYDRHLKKKITCDNTEKINNNIKKRTCTYCKKIFARVDTLMTHLSDNTCKVKQIAASTDANIEDRHLKETDAEIFAQLLKEMQDMKNKITELEASKESTKSINNVKGNLVKGT